MFYMAKREATPAGPLKRPQDNSFLTQETYHCSYGPQDNRSCVPEALTQKQPSQGSRVSETARGESRKRGCLSQFTASRLYLYPDVMRLSIRNSDHTDAHGNAVHGCGVDAKGVKHLHGTCSVSDHEGLGPHQLVEWQHHSANPEAACQISKQPQPAATQPAAANSEPGVAQADDSAKPAGDGQLQHPQKFVMGWMTPFMKDNLLKHGSNNIILLDATFGTNHMKMPLYTGLVIDEFGNGVPAFMVLCQSVNQEDIGKWLAALLQHVRQHHPDWMCSCIMVDDAIAEINAIR